MCAARPGLQSPRLGLPPPFARLPRLREPPRTLRPRLSRRPTGPPRAMVLSQEEPAAEQETNEAQPPGPAPSDDAPLPGPGPSDVSDVAAEKVEVELTTTGNEPPVPPEGGWGWLVMLAAMWCNGSVFGIQNAYGVLFVSMLEKFGAKDDDNINFKTGGTLRRSRGTGDGTCVVGNGRLGASSRAGRVSAVGLTRLTCSLQLGASLYQFSHGTLRQGPCFWKQVAEYLPEALYSSFFCRVGAKNPQYFPLNSGK